MNISKEYFVECAKSISNVYENFNEARSLYSNTENFEEIIINANDLLCRLIDMLYEMVTDDIYNPIIEDICWAHGNYCTGESDTMAELTEEMDDLFCIGDEIENAKSHGDFYDLVQKYESCDLKIDSNIVMFPESRILH